MNSSAVAHLKEVVCACWVAPGIQLDCTLHAQKLGSDGMSQLFFAQKAFILRDQCLLLVRKSLDDPNQPGLWEVPGGRMDFGEDIDEHLKREVREEVGLEIVPGDPFHIWQWRVSRVATDGSTIEWQIVAVARVCRPLSGELSSSARVEGDYLADMKWVPLSALQNHDLIPNMRPVIDSFLRRTAAGVGSQ